MALSAKDKKRIYREEQQRLEEEALRQKVRQELAATPAKAAPKKGSAAGCMILLLLTVVVIAVVGRNSNRAPDSKSSDTSETARKEPAARRGRTVGVGEEGFLTCGLQTVLVAVDKPAFEALTKAAAAKDNEGMAELLLRGRVFSVPSGTRVRMIDIGLFKSEVRILDGDHYAESGWVPAEWVTGTPPETHPTSAEVTITRAEYGDAWPFTVESGVLRATQTGRTSRGTLLAEVTFTTGGRTYSVNGIAKGRHRYEEIDAIWAADPRVDGLKKNIGPIIDRGLKLVGAD